MKLSNFLMVKAIVCFLFGIGFALIPVKVGSMFAITLDPDGLIMTRFFAAVLIGIGLILWINRNADWNVLNSITLSLCIADTIGFIAALVGQLTGNMNALGWTIVVIWLFFSSGLGYYRIYKQNAS
jgi:hypothetical protein